jgi:hypothetical protein
MLNEAEREFTASLNYPEIEPNGKLILNMSISPGTFFGQRSSKMGTLSGQGPAKERVTRIYSHSPLIVTAAVYG